MSGEVTYTDLLYDERDGVATITINRPEKLNAFRGKTCDESRSRCLNNWQTILGASFNQS